MSSLKYVVTGTSGNKLYWLDENFAIERFQVLDRPRGIMVWEDGCVLVAGWSDVYCCSIPRDNSSMARAGSAHIVNRAGNYNHDILPSGNDGTFALVGIPGGMAEYAPFAPEALDRWQPNEPDKCFINTAFSVNDYTTLTVRTPEGRGFDHDTVVINNQSMVAPEGERWTRPHHLLQHSSGDWYVANSGAGQIVNVSTGEVLADNLGFVRGLLEEPISGDILGAVSSIRGPNPLAASLVRVALDGTANTVLEFPNDRDLYEIKTVIVND